MADAEGLGRGFDADLARRIRELMAEFGYQPLMLVGVSDSAPVWIGLNPDVGDRPQYRQLVEHAVNTLVHELGMMAFLDGLE